jgi:hypothetical protein
LSVIRKGGVEIEAAILRLLHERGAGKTICPSEVARAVAGEDESAWRPLMEPVRAAAQQLVDKGSIVATQRGRTVNIATAQGPIRLRLK